MKKHLLFLFATLLPLVASAQKVEIDGIWYNLIAKAKQAEVTFKGNSYNEYDDEYSGSITIPATVTYDGVEYNVTSIGDESFRGCNWLTAISIPESVTSIGELAFHGCNKLTDINIPEGVTSIGENAFRYCRNLTDINIPKGVTKIQDYTFSECTSLTNITLPEGVTSIGNIAFSDCTSLTIGGSAFDGCISLTNITIPEGVTSILLYAFRNCRSLTNITIPEGVTSIDSETFYGCTSLTTIVLPKSVKYVFSKAFANCSELTDVYCYAESVPSTKADAFDGSYPEYATLYVPTSALNDYKSSAPWSSFGTIKTIENVTLEKCATPTISYVDGKVVFVCDTEGATVKSNIKENIAGDYNDMEVAFIPTYTITAYATKAQYENSDEVTLTLCWVPCKENHGDDNGILTIPSHPVLISTQGGTITLSGLAEGTEIAVYTTAGTEVATATATNGTATLTTGLEAGSIAIVKIGNYSIKVAIK